MPTTNQELEVKFYAPSLEKYYQRLENLNAELVQPRILEVNLRFDDASGRLKSTHQVLRLRQDATTRLTYKGPSKAEHGVRSREEIEFTVSDFDTAKTFFEALGYRVVFKYEKYRTIFQLGKVLVTLDELPYGNFIEVEGKDSTSIRKVSKSLGLDWDIRILVSYTYLFDRLKTLLNLPFEHLTFDNFKGLLIRAEDLLGTEERG